MSIFHDPLNPITILILIIIIIFSFNSKIKNRFLNKSLAKKKIASLYILISILSTIIISDQVGRAIKNLEIRERPWVNQSELDMNCPVCTTDEQGQFNGGGRNKSFPSNHSANAFALAFIISFFFPNLKKTLYGIAIVIMFSRIYLGVHYPFDALSGMILGLLSGFMVTKLFSFYIYKKSN